MTLTDLCIVADADTGGLGAVAAAHARWFSEAGCRVVLIAPSTANWARAALPDEVVIETAPLPDSIREVRRARDAVSTLRELLAKHQPAIVHCHGMRSLLLAQLAGRRDSAVTNHGFGPLADEPPFMDPLRRLALRAIPRRASTAISATPELSGHGWHFMPHASPTISELSFMSHSTPVNGAFLWIGRLTAPKDPATFVRAMALLHQTEPRARGIVLGDGPMRSEVEKLALEQQAPIDFAGHHEKIEDYLLNARAVVLTSHFEALAFSVQEAMWVGCPVIVSPLPSLRWLVGQCGLIAGDHESLAREMARLLDDIVAAGVGRACAEQLRTSLQPNDPWPTLAEMYRERPGWRSDR